MRVGWGIIERGSQRALTRRPHGLLVAFGVAASGPPVAAHGEALKGAIAPEIRLEGVAGSEACTYAVRSEARSFEPPPEGAPLELAPGAYELLVECRSGDRVLTPPVPDVRVAAGRTERPKIDVRAGRLRVEARRDGVMLPAKVRLLAPSAPFERAPLAELPANQKWIVAQGRYDALVTLDDPKLPRAEAWLQGSVVAGDPVTVLAADLSDGSLTVSAAANGRPAAASVRVFPPGSAKDVASADAGEELKLPAGRYVVRTELRDTADFATKRSEIWIRAGRLLRHREMFDTGQLSVSVQRDGRHVPSTIRVSLPGGVEFFNHFQAPGTITLSPGTYDVSVDGEGLQLPTAPTRSGVRVARGQHVRVAFDLTPATLSVTVQKAGRPIDADVHVRAAGGGPPSGGGGATNGPFRLWPGRYEIVVRLPDGEEILDGPFEVRLGQKLSRTVTVARAVLIVSAARGKRSEADAEVLVFRPGATKPSARGRSGARLELPLGVYDVKVVAGADIVWREGVRLKSLRVLRVELPESGRDETLPEGDATAPPDELPEGDAPGPTAPPRSPPQPERAPDGGPPPSGDAAG